MERGFIIALVFAIIVAIFAINNSAPVMVDFIFTEIQVSQALVILVSSVFGAIIIAVISGVKNLKFKRENKLLTEELDKTKLEKKNLEAILEDRIKEISDLKSKTNL